MSLCNITTLIETAAILDQTLANQVEQSQQLSQELRANATEQIGIILKAKRLERLDPHPLLTSSFDPSSNNRAGLSHWKGKPVILLEDWIQIRG